MGNLSKTYAVLVSISWHVFGDWSRTCRYSRRLMGWTCRDLWKTGGDYIKRNLWTLTGVSSGTYWEWRWRVEKLWGTGKCMEQDQTRRVSWEPGNETMYYYLILFTYGTMRYLNPFKYETMHYYFSLFTYGTMHYLNRFIYGARHYFNPVTCQVMYYLNPFGTMRYLSSFTYETMCYLSPSPYNTALFECIYIWNYALLEPILQLLFPT